MHDQDLVELLKEYYGRYPGAGFGSQFKQWAESDDLEPYGSWGNGSAMRVSPVAWAFDTLADVLHQAKATARVTHNHPEAIKGAQAVAAAIFLSRSGATKWALRDEIERRFHYDLSFTLDDIRPAYTFDSSCAGTVPPAIVAFLESSSFESAIRLAVSLGGDCDTLACIAGGIAAAHYGVPDPIREQAMKRLDKPLLEICNEFECRYPEAAKRSGNAPAEGDNL
jgi:ADP-ribosylglycohydrolase